MKLTALQVRNAKPRAMPYKLGDGRSLYLLVMPQGGKLWRMSYRVLGKQKTLALGRWPDVELAEARERLDLARKKIACGRDPGEERKLAKVQARLGSGHTFEAVAEEWLAKNAKEGMAETTQDKLRWLLAMAQPLIGRKPIADITTHEALLVLKKIEATGRYETARRMRSVLSRVFRYAIATLRAERDVTQGLRGALITPKVTHLAAITTASEAGGLMRAIDHYSGHLITRIALRLSPHVFVRPGELRKAEWREIDLPNRLWLIPADKMKMRFPHRVPLSRQVIELIEELRPLTCHSPYLFPSPRTWKRPMSENAINGALRRLGYGPEEMTAHGFRAMAATLLNETGLWHADAIERQLAHLENNGVRRAYTRGEHWDERVRMMQHWSDYLDNLRGTAVVVKGQFQPSLVRSGAR